MNHRDTIEIEKLIQKQVDFDQHMLDILTKAIEAGRVDASSEGVKEYLAEQRKNRDKYQGLLERYRAENDRRREAFAPLH